MHGQASPWHAHALQRTATGPLAVPARMEWTTKPGSGPGAEILGPSLHGKRLLELGCGPGHNAAHLASRHGAHVTGIDLAWLQIHRARSHYGQLDNLTFITGHALHQLHATHVQFDAIYSVFGAVGLVAPELLLPAVAQHLAPGRLFVFSVPHPQRDGRNPADDDRPRHDHVTLPDHTQLPIERWDFDADRWDRHLGDEGLLLTSAQEFHATLLITACKS